MANDRQLMISYLCIKVTVALSIFVLEILTTHKFSKVKVFSATSGGHRATLTGGFDF